MLKTVYTPKTAFYGGYKYSKTIYLSTDFGFPFLATSNQSKTLIFKTLTLFIQVVVDQLKNHFNHYQRATATPSTSELGFGAWFET